MLQNVCVLVYGSSVIGFPRPWGTLDMLDIQSIGQFQRFLSQLQNQRQIKPVRDR